MCHHFHLSLQSGSNDTLKRMNRRYTLDEFREAVKLLRDNFEEVMLTADVIVGFPGETKEEFDETYKFLEEIKFYKIHVFKYSIRENTKAATFPNQIAPEIKEERSKKIIELSNIVQRKYNELYIGKTLEVLVEEKHGEHFRGHTKNYIDVNIENVKDNIENEIIKVKIERIESEILIGKM